MTKIKKNNHIHLLQKRNLTRNKLKEPYRVLACIKPFCTYYIREDLSLGKEFECFRCHKTASITKKTLKLRDKLHCDECVNSRHKDEVDKLKELFGQE